jgi:phosphorylcholine metabolism protein LicD
MKQFQATKVHYTENERDKDGNLKTYITSEDAFNKALKKATDAKEPLPEMIVSQSAQYSVAETVGEALKLSGVTVDVGPIDDYVKDNNIDVTLFLDTFNNTAAILKQHNEFADLIRDTNFQAQEGAIELAYSVAQKSERAKMSPEERAIKDLSKGGIVVTPEQLMAALALIKQQASAASA